jgi:hypothetical protein
MGKAFLQSGTAGRLIKVVQASSSVDDYERSSVIVP